MKISKENLYLNIFSEKTIIFKLPYSFFEEEDLEYEISELNPRKSITLVYRHHDLYDAKINTICLIEDKVYNIFNENIRTFLYLGVIKNIQAVSTFDSRVSIEILGVSKIISLNQIGNEIQIKSLKNRFYNEKENDPMFLTKKMSEILSKIIIEKDFSLIDSFVIEEKEKHDNEVMLNDGIEFALKSFGINPNQKEVLEVEEYRLREDNVITRDANEIDGFLKESSNYNGKTAFRKKGANEYLTVYLANKNNLELLMGVDLIYVNETKNSIVMVQYKMLEGFKTETKYKTDWIFRHDEQTKKEIQRMKIPRTNSPRKGYRLNSNPFYFRFVRRTTSDVNNVRAINISLDHFLDLINSDDHKGPKGGIRISYESLNGVYLRQTEFIELINSGYIGTYDVDTRSLKVLIEEVSKGNKSLILAWEHYNKENN